MARSLLFQSNVPLVYWSDCVSTAAFLINHTPSQLLGNKSPYELLLLKQPDYSLLRTFGCLCYVSTLPKHRTKFSPRARASGFLGYLVGYKGYEVLDLESNSVYISRDIVFHEHVFPFKSDSSSFSSDFFHSSILPAIPVSFSSDHNHASTSSAPAQHASSPLNHPATSPVHTHSHINTSPLPTSIVPPPVVSPLHSSHSSNTIQPPSVSTSEIPLVSAHNARPKRMATTPKYLTEYHCYLTQSRDFKKPSHTTPYPLSDVLSYDNISPPYKNLILTFTANVEPKSFLEALKSDKWTKAMNVKLIAFEDTNTWDVVT